MFNQHEAFWRGDLKTIEPIKNNSIAVRDSEENGLRSIRNSDDLKGDLYFISNFLLDYSDVCESNDFIIETGKYVRCTPIYVNMR